MVRLGFLAFIFVESGYCDQREGGGRHTASGFPNRATVALVA